MKTEEKAAPPQQGEVNVDWWRDSYHQLLRYAEALAGKTACRECGKTTEKHYCYFHGSESTYVATQPQPDRTLTSRRG